MVTCETSAVADGGEFLPHCACREGLSVKLHPDKGGSQDEVSWQLAGWRRSLPQPLKTPSLLCQFLNIGEFKDDLLLNQICYTNMFMAWRILIGP